MTLLMITLSLVFGFYFLWVHFLAVMKLQDVLLRGELKGQPYLVGRAVLTVGLLADLIWQILPATFQYLDWPRELTVSGRIKRLCNTGTGWRKEKAEKFRDTWLKPYDSTGGHD